PAEHRRAADPGHQRLRHPSPSEAGADQGRHRRARGALCRRRQRQRRGEQVMSKHHSAYDVIVSPVITEKSTLVSEANQVIFNVSPRATKKEIKEAIETLFKVKVKAVNTLVRKGKLKTFRGHRALQSDAKKAIVTLVEGHHIDIATGL